MVNFPGVIKPGSIAIFFFTAACGPLAMRAAAVTRWWRACGREGRSCGLTAATSARPVCAVRCGRELNSESLQSAHSRLCVQAPVSGPGIARQCANVSQMIQQPKFTLYPVTGSPRGAVHRGPTLHTALTAQAPHAGEETRVRTSSLLQHTAHPGRALVAAVSPQPRPSRPQALHHLVTAAALTGEDHTQQ